MNVLIFMRIVGQVYLRELKMLLLIQNVADISQLDSSQFLILHLKLGQRRGVLFAVRD